MFDKSAFLSHFDVTRNDAVVDERGEAVHEQDAEHHAFGISGIDDAQHHSEDADEQTINPLARVGLCRRDGVGGHEDRTEHKAAHQVVVVERQLHIGVGTDGVEQQAHEAAANDGGEHDAPAGNAGEQQYNGT